MLKKKVQIIENVLYHILVNGEILTWKVVYFLFGSKLNKLLANVRRNGSKLLIFLSGTGLRNSCLTYFN